MTAHEHYQAFFEDALQLIHDLRGGIRTVEDLREFNNFNVSIPKNLIEASGVNYRGIQERVLQTRYGHLLAHTLRAAVLGSLISDNPAIAEALVLEIKKRVVQNNPVELIDSQHALFQSLASLRVAGIDEAREDFVEAVKMTVASGLFLPVPFE